MEETLPGVGDDGPGERVVCHVDMDCFYASCERLKEPELAGEPVVVGMGYESGKTHGAVATASYEAREYGVDSAQPISDALDRLPRAADADSSDPDAPDPEAAGHYRPVDMEFYESVASDVKAVLHDLADTVREVSIDEAYLDVTDRTRWDRVGGDAGDTDPDTAAGGAVGTSDERDGGRTLAEGFARHVREEIQRRVGVPASVGVAPNMAVAKVASDYDKPDGLTVVPPDRVREFLAPLPVEDIHGVGPVRAREFADMEIETAGDLAAADPTTLVEQFGDRGRELYDRARGRDDREVTPRGRPKSLSRESAFTEATSDDEAKREKVRALAADVAERARSRDATYQTIGIKAVRPPFDVNTRAESLSGPVDDPELVREVALELLEEFADDEVRKLGVRVSKLSFGGGDQATLGGYDATDGDRSEGSEATSGAASGAPSDGSHSAAEPVASATLDEWETESRDRTPPETLAEWAADAGTTDRSDDTETDDGVGARTDAGRDANGRRRRRQPSLRSFDTAELEGGGATEVDETADGESDDGREDE